MSWSATWEKVPGSSGDVRLDRSEASYAPDPDACPTEVRDQYDAGCAAAAAIIRSGAAGASGKEFRVTLSGHAEPGHTGNEFVNVSVQQL